MIDKDDDEDDFISEDDNKKKTVKKIKKDNNDKNDAKKNLKSGKPEQKKLTFFKGFLNRPSPSALGSKELPKGEKNCLQDKTFAFTGELTSITKEKAQDLVKQHGGRVTTSMNNTTSFVVLGDDPGPKKLNKIEELNIPTLDEDGLFNLIKESRGNSEPRYAESPTNITTTSNIINGSSNRKGKAIASFVREPIRQSAPPEIIDPKHLIWVDRYRPNSLKELCGNKTSIGALKTWLHDWETNFKTGFKCKANGKYPAVLISGPPGIGKTTAAHLVGKDEGYDIKEFNASDVRNKKTLDLAIKIATGNMSITSFYNSNATNVAAVTASSLSKDKEKSEPSHTDRTLIIMDEVDGMSTGDRGGTQELIQIIKKSKVPIICICNDNKSQKMKSFTNLCQEIKFQRENLKISGNVVDAIIKGTNTDIRQVMNLLSCWKLSENSIDFDQGKQLIKNSEKDIVLNVWDASAKLFNPITWLPNNNISLNEKLGLYFHDPDLAPLMIQENYITKPCEVASKEFVYKNMNRNVDPKLIKELAVIGCLSKAADFISKGDLISGMIHGSQQQWSLMPFHGMVSTVIPSYYSCGRGQYHFPSWLGQNSKAMRNKRALSKIQSKLRLKCNANKDEILMDYIPALLTKLYHPLIDEYGLTKEDWETIIELGMGSKFEAAMKKINSKTKTNLTKRYNVTHQPMISVKKGKHVDF
ncbi:15632_t:CDS:10 [Entrophospora sp. SA101]|nr:15632_t:CDS:10 [Entrophospora sp. SA101]